MDRILKSATIVKSEASESELALINLQSLKELTAEDVYIFRLAACNNQVDRDFERFTDAALEQLAEMYVGKPVLMDHSWSASKQTARVYAADVEEKDNAKHLVLRCYMPRTAQLADTIEAIDSGILKECSVGVAVRQVICNICGANQIDKCCEHYAGYEYNGAQCVMELGDVSDAYEVSLVAVPAQPAAGVIKSKRYGSHEHGAHPDDEQGIDDWAEKAYLEIEKTRFII